MNEGETTNDLFGFLTTEPNDVVAPIHPKALLVVLTTREQVDIWMNAPAEEALRLQRAVLSIVAKGQKGDGDD